VDNCGGEEMALVAASQITGFVAAIVVCSVKFALLSAGSAVSTYETIVLFKAASMSLSLTFPFTSKLLRSKPRACNGLVRHIALRPSFIAFAW
jgi:hypothetical protein